MESVALNLLRGIGYVLAGLLCIGGLGISVLSISGTWLVLAAAVLLAVCDPGDFPGWWTFGVFVLLCVAVEGVEALASSWGVKARGGSTLAGVAALVGGLFGLAFGAVIPVPIVGPLLGMIAGSFGGAFAVESYRLKHRGQAASIAWGAVVARLGVVLMKVVVTVGMAIALWGGLLLGK